MTKNNIQRNFILGSQWIYYKIYSGAKTSDTILTEIIKPVSEQLLENKIIDKWFFIRYSDPKHHLRVRFHYSSPKCIYDVTNRLYPHFEWFLENDLIWKIQTDTYQRELERYGHNSMDIAEELFYYDSKMIVNFISIIMGHNKEEVRWLFSLKAIDSLLDCFKYTDIEKRNLLSYLKTSYGEEFGMNRLLKKQLDDKYRKEQEKIYNIMTPSEKNKENYFLINELITIKEKETEKIVGKIFELKESNDLGISIDNLVCSYIHMLMNRLFKSHNRMHEMICYDFLYRHYRSVIARTKNKVISH